MKKDWYIKEHPGRTQPFTLWHVVSREKGCRVTPHVHIFTEYREVAENHIAMCEKRWAGP